MNELVDKVAQKTGLSPEQAKSAAESVLEFLKARLPEPLASQLNSIVSSERSAGEAGSGMLENATVKLGGMFGKDK